MKLFSAIMIILVVLLILYLLAIKPRLLHRPAYKPFYDHMYAHRGLHNMNSSIQNNNMEPYPENSYASIKRAVEYGYGIEFDVHLTKDEIPVIFHDDSLLRICGIDAKLKDYTYEELQQFRLLDTDQIIPTLEDVLSLVDGKVPLIIEYKVEKNAATLCNTCNKILSDYKGLYCIESFHPFALLWYRKNRPDIVRGQLAENFMQTKSGLLFFLLSHLLFNAITAPDFIAYNSNHYSELSRTICRKLYRSLSVAWTIRSQDELEHIKKHFDLFIFEDFIPKI